MDQEKRTAPMTVPISDDVVDAAETRKQFPVASGFLDYFPLAVLYVSHVSWQGNQQHHPDQPLHWDRCKSTDETDAAMRHFLFRDGFDDDGIRELGKAAWRIMAELQKQLEADCWKMGDK